MPFHFTPDCFKTQGKCIKFKTQEIYDKTVRGDPRYLEFISVDFKTQKMCIKAIEKVPWMLWCVPDHLNTRGMCEKGVDKFPRAL